MKDKNNKNIKSNFYVDLISDFEFDLRNEINKLIDSKKNIKNKINIDEFDKKNLILKEKNSPNIYIVEKSTTNTKKIRKDENLITRINDIVQEVKNYQNQLRNKIIICNSNDGENSNFFKFFRDNFDKYELKKLISIKYIKDFSSYKLEINNECSKINDKYIPIKTFLKGNGNFESDECIELLKESDVVITCPPSDKFNDFINLIIKYEKEYLILVDSEKLKSYKIFNLIKNHNIKLGYSRKNNFIFDSSEGEKKNKMYWFTNLKVKNENNSLVFSKNYSKKNYEKYDNYNAIHIDKIKNIPLDYYKPMGVPASFLSRWNHHEFEIISTGYASDFKPNRKYHKPKEYYNGKVQNSSIVNSILVLSRKEKPEGHYFKSIDSDYLIDIPNRIIIKRIRVKNE